jgi:predicted TIM-barrel fold metal-dependent hydrolase
MTTPLAVARAAAACPEATIILGHMGGYFHVDEAIEVAEECENVLAADAEPRVFAGNALRLLDAVR